MAQVSISSSGDDVDAAGVPSPAAPLLGDRTEGTEEQVGAMLHCLQDTEDAIEDEGGSNSSTVEEETEAVQEEQGMDEKQRRAKRRKDQEEKKFQQIITTVGRPAPSVLGVAVWLVDRSTGVFSTLRFNMRRDAGPLDMTLLRARYVRRSCRLPYVSRDVCCFESATLKFISVLHAYIHTVAVRHGVFTLMMQPQVLLIGQMRFQPFSLLK